MLCVPDVKCRLETFVTVIELVTKDLVEATVVYCERDKGAKGQVVQLGRHDSDRKAESRDTLGRKLACCLSVCVFAISNRCSKDSCCAHKGLVTNWSHPDRPI
jgi:hypothetical protein